MSSAHGRRLGSGACLAFLLAGGCLTAGLCAAEPLDLAGTHWAFQPLHRPSLPAPSVQARRILNPVDAFVLEKLAANKLSFGPEADRRTLLRRVYFDLIGLAPTPEEVQAFEQDTSPDAYERRVDQLLASPRYGERWARHWLDVVRFAETHGFEMNQPRPNAWPYRDYVIRAFNEDLPYDRFVIEQLAGDVCGADAATGFLVSGSFDQVKSPDPVLTANQRADELHDMVSTTGSAFLGLTVGCARCHNHKFDPISQNDYYGLKAIFEGVQHAERKLKTPETEGREQELVDHRARLAAIDTALIEFEPLAQTGDVDTNRLRAPVHPRRNVERFAPVLAQRLRVTILKTTDAEPCIDELEVFTAEAPPRNVALADAGTRARASSVYPNSEIHRLEHINDGRYGNSRSWISNERGRGWVELEFAAPVSINRVLWARDREQKFSDRLATDYRIEVALGSNDWHVVASSADRMPYAPGHRSPAASLAGLDPAQAAEVNRLLEERARHEARIDELTRVPMVYGGTFVAQPEPTYRLHRGDPMQRREVIAPAAIDVIPVRFDLNATPVEAPPVDLSAALTENQRRRLALARWIVNPANPLTARVMVNRLWQWHFGDGLVATPSDFGANGARPTHPELLDWLAAELMQPSTGGGGAGTPLIVRARGTEAQPPRAWSLKHIHRLLVTSATYRQASDARREALAVDAGSRWLWRFPPRRLDAEPIRDQILAASGKLDLRMGGPGFSFFEPNDNYVRVYTPRREWPSDTFRRMIYGTEVRQRPDGVFGVFDCPDGGQIAPKRTRSTTPLQALNLLNSSFVWQQAGFFAERLQREAGLEVSAQVRRGFALTFQRAPATAELAAGTRLVREQGLAIFCRALFNANEFVYAF